MDEARRSSVRDGDIIAVGELDDVVAIVGMITRSMRPL